MLKKIFLTLSAIIVLSLPYQQQYAEGAIFSKVASKGAQKIVKEVIKESAFDMAVNIFIDEAYSMALEERQKYQAQQDYEVFCGKKMPDLITCEKPMQAKTNLTPTDKANIGNQAEIELDKLITNGKGFTRWQKFLDWFLPIWVASFALTAITYAVDPEVRSLFNEAGYNALVALGLIKPVTENVSGKGLDEVNEPQPTIDNGQDTTTGAYTKYAPSPTSGLSAINAVTLPNISAQNTLAIMNIYDPSTLKQIDIKPNTGNNSISWTASNIFLDNRTYTNGVTTSIEVGLNGTLLETIPKNTSVSGSYSLVYNFTTATSNAINPLKTKVNSVLYRVPYQINGFLFTDVLFNTVDGDIITFRIKSDLGTVIIKDPMTQFYIGNVHTASPVSATRVTVYPQYFNDRPTLIPEYDEIATQLDLTPKTKYENDEGEMALIPPSALPYIQTSTGIQLTPETDPNTGEQKFTTPSGESVPEDDITVGEPNIQENPSPSPNTVTPPATQTNPNPEPIPLTPTTPQLPPNPPPPTETLPPVFPEGESCEVGLKLPKISPLAFAVSESFPFSIPFDLYDGFQAIFSEMGNEKPEFNYKFDFMGDQQEWKISIPDYFDSWKRFTDSFLIFVFDVGIIFMIFRFMGGNK